MGATMSRVCSALCVLLFVVLCSGSLDLSQIQVISESGKVVQATLKNKQYSFNATVAAEVCSAMGVSIASRSEVETAMSNGLQTCRYGWVKEKVAVIPRIERNPKCGKNNTGLTVWRAEPSRLFEVFCFNLTGQTDESKITTTESVGRPEATTTPSLVILPTLSNKSFLLPSKSVLQTSSALSTSTASTDFSSSVHAATTRSPRWITTFPVESASSSSSAPSSSSISVPSSHPITSSSSLTTSFNQTERSPTSRFSFGEVPLACVIIAVMLLVMAALGAVWYFKIKHSHRLPSWVRIRHNDTVETEMWKHTDESYFSSQSNNGMCADDITLQLDEDTEPY